MTNAPMLKSPLTGKRMCTRCLFDETTPAIRFDEQGVCSYCHLCEDLDRQYPNDERGDIILQQTADRIRKENKRKPFDVVVGVSGGCDSSLLVIKAVELGLRPLAAHFDNTWNSRISTENIHNVLKKLGVELYTHVVDNEVYDDIYRAFMLSGSPDLECPTDIGLAAVLYEAAAKYGTRYIFEGHSFRTEGVSPLGWLYMDGKYTQSVVKEFGLYREHKLRTYPNLWMHKFLYWTAVKRIQKVRPLYWMRYDKEETKKMLVEKYGWQWYGGHHLENRFTAFFYSYYLPRRLNLDTRINGFSALVRVGQMTREQAFEELSTPPHIDMEIVEMVKKRLGFTEEEFDRLMKLPVRTFREFKTYKSTFERMRPFFWILAQFELVPKSFYVKYTAKQDMGRLQSK